MKARLSLANTTDRPQFISLELSTARFRLDPGEEAILAYDATETQDGHGSVLRIEFVDGELVIWTGEDTLLSPDGTPQPRNYELIG
jgi:hypothetical protein